jgi:hypothetical protein
MQKEELDTLLINEEIVFCELFVNGCAPYCGNAPKCYEAAFKIPSESSNTLAGPAKKLLSQEYIQDYIENLEISNKNDTKYLKKRLTENLLGIIDEVSSASFYDRNGTKLSVAPLRSVAVQATKALMDMHPIKEANVNKFNIEGNGGGITFNVIIPTKEEAQKETEE